MAATKRVIVYGAVSGIPRRVIVPDSDTDIDGISQRLHTGEAMTIVDIGDTRRPRDIVSVMVPALTQNRSLFPDRCMVINIQGLVVDTICADPTIDTIPGMILVQSDVAGVGWTFAAEIFTPPLLTVIA